MGERHLLILASGWSCPEVTWNAFESLMRNYGFDTFQVDYNQNSLNSIEGSAKKAQREIVKLVDYYDRISFIGHSTGGLLGLSLVYDHGMEDVFDAYVSIACPHKGAYLAPFTARWSTAARQVRPDSCFIARIDAMNWPSHKVEAHNILASYENIILPSGNTKCDFAITQTVVPGTSHLSILDDYRTADHVAGLLQLQASHPETLVEPSAA